MKNLSVKIFIDVFLFLFLILCLRKLKELNEMPTSTELVYVVIAALVIGQGLSYMYKRLNLEEKSKVEK